MDKAGTIKYRQEIASLLRRQGPTGLYRGFWITAWRDIPGWAIYFTAFEKLKILNSKISNYYGGSETT